MKLPWGNQDTSSQEPLEISLKNHLKSALTLEDAITVAQDYQKREREKVKREQEEEEKERVRQFTLLLQKALGERVFFLLDKEGGMTMTRKDEGLVASFLYKGEYLGVAKYNYRSIPSYSAFCNGEEKPYWEGRDSANNRLFIIEGDGLAVKLLVTLGELAERGEKKW